MNEAGLRRSAILMSQLKPEVAEQVLDALDVATSIRLRDRIAALNQADLAERAAVLAQFDAASAALPASAPVNDGAFGKLAEMSPREAAQLLTNEPPRAIAAMLGQLDVEQARSIAEYLSPATRERVRACLDDQHVLGRDALDELELALEEILAQRDTPPAGVPDAHVEAGDAARALFDRLGRVRDVPEHFSQLAALDDTRLRQVLDQVDRSLLVAAFKAADPRSVTRLLSVLGATEAKALHEQLLLCPPLRVAEIEAAQAAVVEAARRQHASEEDV